MPKSMCSTNSENQVQQLVITEWNEQRQTVISSLLSLVVFCVINEIDSENFKMVNVRCAHRLASRLSVKCTFFSLLIRNLININKYYNVDRFIQNVI